MRNQEIDSKILEAWQEFNQLYPDEEAALLALYRLTEKEIRIVEGRGK